MTPVKPSEKFKKEIVRRNLYGVHISVSKKLPGFKVGDRAGISKYKRAVFDKDCTPNLTEEIFVSRAMVHTNPITYALKDLMH